MPQRSSHFRRGQRVLVEGTPFGGDKPLEATVERKRTIKYADGTKHEKVDVAYTRTDTRGIWHTSVEPSDVTPTKADKQRTK